MSSTPTTINAIEAEQDVGLDHHQINIKTPRPPYNLAALGSATRVYFCMRETAAKAASSIGLVATVSSGGARAVRKTDWSPLAGRECVVLPSNDGAGEKYAKDVAKILEGLSPPARVKIVRLPKLPPGGDIVDYLDDRDSVEPDDLRGQIEGFVEAAEWTKKPPFEIVTLSTDEFLATDYRRNYLIDRVIVEGQAGIIGGKQKVLKTTLAVDMAISAATGTMFLGAFSVAEPMPVAFITGESGGATIQETARRIARARGIPLTGAPIRWGLELPRLSRGEHRDALVRLIELHAIRLLIIDPLYLALLDPAQSSGASNLYSMGSYLLPLSELAAKSGVTLVLLHHFRKNSPDKDRGSPPELEELAQSGCAEWARQWLLVARRERYQPGSGSHRLWLSAGGSAGHGGLWGVDVEEGDTDALTGRKWEVTVHTVDQVQTTAATTVKMDATKKLEAEDVRVEFALSAYKNGETATKLREHIGMSGAKFTTIIQRLLASGKAIQVDIEKAGTTYQGYKLAPVAKDET